MDWEEEFERDYDDERDQEHDDSWLDGGDFDSLLADGRPGVRDDNGNLVDRQYDDDPYEHDGRFSDYDD